MRYLIKNGSIIDPTQRVATVGHLLIEDGKVVQLFNMAELPSDDSALEGEIEVIYAQGCMIAPGFTDLHMHLCTPVAGDRETIANATGAAARGGFTTICAMPDTAAPCDTPPVVRQVRQTALYNGLVRVDVVGAATQGGAGTQLADMAELMNAGCIAFSDAGNPIHDPLLMRHILTYTSMLGVPMLSHCEDAALAAGWAMHEGMVSTRLGLPGFPAAAEEIAIARNIALAELTGAHLHLCRLSTAGGVKLVRNAKQRGIRVTAEVTPHHLTLTDEWVLGSLAPPLSSGDARPDATMESASKRKRSKGKPQGEREVYTPAWLDPTHLPPYDTSTRVCPPLRSRKDVDALLEGLKDNTIDAIATDHLPCTSHDKAREYSRAACGISGTETAFGLALSLVHQGLIDIMDVVHLLTEGPAHVLGRAPTTLIPGARADLVIFDPEYTWTVDAGSFATPGRNTPLHGQHLKGQVMLTMVGGDIVFRHDAFLADKRSAPQASRLAGILPDEEE